MKMILVADDEPQVVQLVSNRLKTYGYDTTLAYNGAEVLECVKNGKPNLIILDIIMPKMSGAEAARRLKENDETKWIPIIFLTALAGKGAELGLEDYTTDVVMGKPFDHRELITNVNELINK
jgi:CheY-like chemotaxis protein